MGALAPTDAIVADGGVLPACTLNSRVGIPIGVKEGLPAERQTVARLTKYIIPAIILIPLGDDDDRWPIHIIYV